MYLISFPFGHHQKHKREAEGEEKEDNVSKDALLSLALPAAFPFLGLRPGGRGKGERKKTKNKMIMIINREKPILPDIPCR